MKGIIPQGRALDPESPAATPFRGKPRYYGNLVFPALLRIKGRTGGESRGTIPTE